MRRIILFLSVVIFSNYLFAQKNQLSIGLSGSLDTYDYNFRLNENQYGEYETNPAFSLGLNFKYNFSEKLFAKGKFQYSGKKYKWIYDYTLVEPVAGTLLAEYVDYKLDYVGIPFFIGYYILNGDKFKMGPSAGLVPEFFINSSQTAIYTDGSKEECEPSDFNKILLSAQINLAFEYHLGNKLFISMEPYFQPGFNTINRDHMESPSLSYGGTVSINYKLN